MVPERHPRRQRGSITLLALCLTAAMAISLGSYLALCHRSQQFGIRQMQTDKTRELAQVGLEEALWALNQDSWASSGPSGNAVWTISGTTRTVTLTYPMASQGMTGQVELTITNYVTLPTMTALTSASWPALSSKATITLAGGEVFAKTLQATTTPVPLFGNAIASAESYVSFAQGGLVDSWHSNSSHVSTFSRVPTAYAAGTAAANYNAVVAGRIDSSATYGVLLTQAEVRGYASTFGLPISYSTSGTPPGKVLGPATSTGVSVDPLRIGKSAFVPVSPVFTVNTPNPSGASNTLLGLLTALLGGVDNILKLNGNLSLTNLVTALLALLGLADTTIVIDRPMKIVVNGNLELDGNGRFRITSTGSLELFVNGDITIGGRGFDNQTNDPKKLAIYSTGTTSTAIRYTTTANFCGVIYSENKPIEIREDAGQFYGALLSRSSVRFLSPATNPQFHYDVALRKTLFPSIKTPYVVSQVTES